MLNPCRRRMMIAAPRFGTMRTTTSLCPDAITGISACSRRYNHHFRLMTATAIPLSNVASFILAPRQPHHIFSSPLLLDPSTSLIRSSATKSKNSSASRPSSSYIDRSSTTTANTKKKNISIKPWLDPQRALSSRVDALLDSPWIHAAEFRVDSDVHALLLECCRLQSLSGQQMATQIMERLLLEKTRLNTNNSSQQQRDNDVDDDDEKFNVCVPERFWQNVIFAWSKLVGKLRVARLHMKENLTSAIEAAKEDYARRQRDQETAVHKDDAVHNQDHASGRNSSNTSSSISEPTLEIFNTFLLGLARAAKNGQPGAAMQAEQTLFDMMEYHEAPFGWHTKPNTRSYTHVINAHVNSRHKTAGGRALNILQHVKQLHEAEKLAYHERCGIPYHERGPNHPRIVTPDGIMYTSVMMAMLNSNMSARRVVELLHEFLDLAKKNTCNDETFQVDASHFTVPIRALGNEIERNNNAAQRVKLAQEAESILNLMFEYMAQKKKQQKVTTLDNTDTRQDEEEDSDVQFPKAIYAFNACLDTWGRAYAQEAALRCEDLLKKMLDKNINTNTASSNESTNNEEAQVVTATADDIVVEPDTVSFNACLQAWSKAHSFYPDAAYRANELLDLFCHLHTSGLIKKGPDLQSWTIAILALQHVTPTKSSSVDDDDGNSNVDDENAMPSSSSSGASIVRRARRLLEEMLDSVQNQSTEVSRNLSGPFTAVIRVAAKMADAESTIRQGEPAAVVSEKMSLAKETRGNGNDPATVDDDALLFGENVDHEGGEDEKAEIVDPYSIACQTYREAVEDLYDLKKRQRTKNRAEQKNHTNNNDYTDNDSSGGSTKSSRGADGSGAGAAGGIADHHTFAAMLTCIDRYNPHPASSERRTFGDVVFADACQAGQVSRVVLHEAAVVLQIPAAMEVADNSKNNNHTNEIPRFWYRNVEGGWRPKSALQR